MARVVIMMTASSLRRYANIFELLGERGLEFSYVEWIDSVDQMIETVDRLTPDAFLVESILRFDPKPIVRGRPMVCLGPVISRSDAVNVAVDDFEIGQLAAKSFLSKGYRHYSYGGFKRRHGELRLKGFCSILESNQIELEPIFWEEKVRRYLDFDELEVSEVQRWAAEVDLPCALFVGHDNLARLMCNALLKLGYRIPEDFAIMGVNDDPVWCLMQRPHLSSIQNPWEIVGQVAVEQLIRLLGGHAKHGESYFVRPRTVKIRHSVDLLAVDNAVVSDCVDWLLENATRHLTVKDMCEELGFCRRTVEKLFAQHLKTTPRNEFMRIRLEKVKSLLVESELTVKEIAHQTGFGNQTRLSETFRKHVCTTPSEYRNAWKAQ